MFRFFAFIFFSSILFAQQTKQVDFIKCSAVLYPSAETKSISGSITYEFKVKQSIDTIKIDAKNMDFFDVRINDKSVKFKNSGKTLDLFEGFQKGKNKLTFSYSAKPKQTLYFTGTDDNLQIWSQGQGKYTSHWLPSFDDVNEKVVFNLSVKFQNGYNVISNGVFKNVNHKRNGYENGFSTYNFQMQQPMSSYLVMLAIGNFEKQTVTTKSGTPLEFYIDKNDYSKFEPTYRYSKQIFDFLEQEIGVKYPWELYRQIPVRDFLYAGMENTTSTIFSQDFVVDSIGFNDRNYVNVNAHELAHQWFGNFITAQSGKHHWLQEGFATYYALLAERHLFGDDYFYEALNDYAEQLQQAATIDSIPVLNEKASSLTFYKKGAWALHVLREDIGAKYFQKAVKKYLKKYQYKNVDTDDFLSIVNNVSGYDVAKYKKQWLETPGFDRKVAQRYLDKNQFIRDFNQLRINKYSLADLTKIMQSDAYYPIKHYIIYKIQQLPFDERKVLLEAALATRNLQVRQAVAETLKVIPLDFKISYEALLQDNAYSTKEIALTNLCANFPEECERYLDQTKGIIGNNDKSFRVTWLGIAIHASGFSEKERQEFLNELQYYASESFESSVRQNALEILLQLQPNEDQVIALLFKATSHHKWQFTLYARTMVRELLKNKTFRNKVEQLAATADAVMKERYEIFLKE
ncbi:M1 family metallopeptidase [Flavobacterium sp.]|jgi:aminopeptidase N|uniref:M1 family metallopeptidase n=1 Tax=Flavobacterium sp. TaxID=239 RepID=UPI0037BEAB3B